MYIKSRIFNIEFSRAQTFLPSTWSSRPSCDGVLCTISWCFSFWYWSWIAVFFFFFFLHGHNFSNTFNYSNWWPTFRLIARIQLVSVNTLHDIVDSLLLLFLFWKRSQKIIWKLSNIKKKKKKREDSICVLITYWIVVASFQFSFLFLFTQIFYI